MGKRIEIATGSLHVHGKGHLPMYANIDWGKLDEILGVETDETFRREVFEACADYCMHEVFAEKGNARQRAVGRAGRATTPIKKLEYALRNASKAWQDAMVDEGSAAILAEIAESMEADLNAIRTDVARLGDLLKLQLSDIANDEIRERDHLADWIKAMASIFEADGLPVTWRGDTSDSEKMSSFQGYLHAIHDMLPGRRRLSPSGMASKIAKTLRGD